MIDNHPEFQPENDGVDHINVYSKGRTELGRLLSNFAHTPFFWDDPVLGRIPFQSVEGWWYWMATHDERLRTLVGWTAKQLGQTLPLVAPWPTREELLKAYVAKGQPTWGEINGPARRVWKMLMENELPFTHYYVYGGKKVATEHEWTGALWAEAVEILRTQLGRGGPCI